MTIPLKRQAESLPPPNAKRRKLSDLTHALSASKQWAQDHATEFQTPHTTSESDSNSEDPLPSCIIFLNGYPGVGKLTIARAMAAQLPPATTRLIDNHLLIDPAQAIHPGRSLAHHALRKELRALAFKALTAEFKDTPNLIVIFTGCLAPSPADTAVLMEHIHLAKSVRVPFFLFDVECDVEEHEQRFHCEERIGSGNSKLTDWDELDRLWDMYDGTLASPEWVGGVEVSHAPVLDVSGAEAEDVAGWILGDVEMQVRHLSWSMRLGG